MLQRFHLQIIREVQSQGTLTAAADRLCLTQSALSHAIKKLEFEVGTPIWIRDGRRLVLTQAGEYLLSVAEHVLPSFETAELRLDHMVKGEQGVLRIGMECHPCYRWLQKIIPNYLSAWPKVDLDIKQKFQFGGIAALLNYEIDLLITPDPVINPRLVFEPVFAYEQVLAVASDHVLTQRSHVMPHDLAQETLITYPVPIDRLDIYQQFLIPAGYSPKCHKTIETTDIMLQMVANRRGVTALPRWLIDEYAIETPLMPLRLGQQGIFKNIYLGIRVSDSSLGYIDAFISMAKGGGV